MKRLAAAAVVLLLAGCATAPRPQVNVIPQRHLVKKVVPVVPAPVVEPTPNQTVQKRWTWDRFKPRIRMFH